MAVLTISTVNHDELININLFRFRSHLRMRELKRFERRNMAGYLVRARASNLPKFELSLWIVNPCFVPGLKSFKLDTYNGIGTWNFTNMLH